MRHFVYSKPWHIYTYSRGLSCITCFRNTAVSFALSKLPTYRVQYHELSLFVFFNNYVSLPFHCRIRNVWYPLTCWSWSRTDQISRRNLRCSITWSALRRVLHTRAPSLEYSWACQNQTRWDVSDLLSHLPQLCIKLNWSFLLRLTVLGPFKMDLAS